MADLYKGLDGLEQSKRPLRPETIVGAQRCRERLDEICPNRLTRPNSNLCEWTPPAEEYRYQGHSVYPPPEITASLPYPAASHRSHRISPHLHCPPDLPHSAAAPFDDLLDDPLDDPLDGPFDDIIRKRIAYQQLAHVSKVISGDLEGS